MEIERIVPPSPLSAIEEELEVLDTREDF
uniref:Uncharacterized protein n=1 Tax=Rhizophora mucronata TaxID=61149 RepID=A0A2P2PWV4_RHIMU